MKKTALLLLALLLVAVMPGCARRQSPSATPAATYSTNDTIEATIALRDMAPAQEGTPSQYLADLIEERFGLKLQPWPITDQNSGARLLEAAAANALPDAFAFPAFEDRVLMKQLLDQKLLRELPESLTAETSALSTLLKRYRSSESVDGKLYFLPRANLAYNYRSGQSQVLYYRADWGRESGKVKVGEAPTWQAFMELMSYFTHRDPDGNKLDDTYALSTAGSGGMDTVFLMTLGIRPWVLQSEQWVPGVLSNRALEAVRWANSACRGGLVDPVSKTQTEEEMLEKFCSGKVGMIVMDGSSQGAARVAAAWEAKQPDVPLSKAVSILPQPIGPYGVSYNDGTSYQGGTAFSSKIEDKKLKRLLKLFDWMLTDDGLMAATYGKLGEHYTMKDGVPQTKLKDAQGKPVLFREKNTQWAAVRTLSTWAEDFRPADDENSFETRCLGILQEYWWVNNWRTPLFTEHMLNESVAAFDDSKAREVLVRMMFESADPQKDWAAYVSAFSAGFSQAQEAVNAYAKEKGIKTEE